MIGIIDYKAGNLTSVELAFRHLGFEAGKSYTVVRHPEELTSCDRLVFPGVGEAGSAMAYLRQSGLAQAMKESVAEGTPLLGICLGCQIILDHSEESDTEALGLIPGQVVSFNRVFAEQGITHEENDDGQSFRLKVPHMGWNKVQFNTDHPLGADIVARLKAKGLAEQSSYYFVHSYYPALSPQYSLATAQYGVAFSAGLFKDNVAAFQFHPEKSAEAGLTLLEAFVDWKP